MAQLADVPIVGGVLHSLAVYPRQSARILRHPFGFVRNIDFEDRAETKRALEFISASIIMQYLIMVPYFLKSEADISQSLFIVYGYLGFAGHAFVLHLILKIMRSRKPIRVTFILYCYMTGLFLPLSALIILPVMMVFMPEFDLGMVDFSLYTGAHIGPYERRLEYVTGILIIMLGLTAILLWVIWISRINQLSLLRTIFAVISVSYINGTLLSEHINPSLWNYIESSLLTVLRFL